MTDKKLTKKQQKAADFRKKRKLDDSIPDVPEEDTMEVDDQVPKSKKAKKDAAATASTKDKGSEDAEAAAGKKKRRRGKGSKDDSKDNEADGGDDKKEAATTAAAPKPKPLNQKFIVFVGNLPYNITKEQLEKHFATCENITSIRVQTDKATGKGKGFAFMEFKTAEDMQKALFFNKTLIKERPINVELTAGGGGNKSEARKKKIADKNEALNEERRKIHEKHIQPSKEAKSSYAASEAQRPAQDSQKKSKKESSKQQEKAVKRPGDISGANAIQVQGLAARLRRE
ncbi:hypothetical protein DFQ26_001322 [Actinomortierella ambigua]|nr:hypothetical protein DFQ26_001322 [Actinomortierella ambigua]